MEQHSTIGERILRNVDDYSEIAAIVRHHHERVDGNGYPDGLVGDEIPLLARIIAVADAYNAMTSDRPYRDAMPSRVARLRLAQAVESQFDTAVVAAFEAVLTGADEAYRMGVRGDFVFEGVGPTRPEPLPAFAERCASWRRRGLSRCVDQDARRGPLRPAIARRASAGCGGRAPSSLRG